MAKINKLLLTKNNCYKTGRKHNVKGWMLHCTGANNPFLSRYIGPDDGLIGYNKYNNHWNQPKPDGISKCVHGFIGYTRDKKEVATYQTLDWDHVGWHSGYGRLGSANTRGFIGIEMCEDGLRDRVYFNECYKQAVELCAYHSKLYIFPITPETVMDHSEGHLKGIASNHGDVKNWFRHHNKTMDDFRSDVKKLLGGTVNPPTSKPVTPNSNILVDGYWGPATTKALQKNLGTSVDGVISGQYPNSVTRAIPSASFTTRTGSNAIKALQRKLKIKADGYIGIDTVKALQRYLGTYVDGVISKPSNMVKELQRRLNKGDF